MHLNTFSLILSITDSYNNLEYCLKTLYETDYSRKHFDVILIDNGSVSVEKSSKLQNLWLSFKNHGISCKKTEILKKTEENISFLYAGLLSKNEWLVYIDDDSFLFPGFLNSLNTSINNYYKTVDVIFPKITIVSFPQQIKKKGLTYYKTDYDPSIHRDKELYFLENENLKFTDLFGCCLRRSKIQLLPASTDIQFFKNILDLQLKLAYIDSTAGVLFTGEPIDFSKKQTLCDELYYGASITH